MQVLQHLWIRARHYPKVALATIVLLVVGAAWILARVVGGKKAAAIADEGTLTRAVDAVRESIAQANSQAAVETAVVRTRDAVVQKELKDTLAIDDGAERRRKLADLSNRLKSETP